MWLIAALSAKDPAPASVRLLVRISALDVCVTAPADVSVIVPPVVERPVTPAKLAIWNALLLVKERFEPLLVTRPAKSPTLFWPVNEAACTLSTASFAAVIAPAPLCVTPAAVFSPTTALPKSSAASFSIWPLLASPSLMNGALSLLASAAVRLTRPAFSVPRENSRPAVDATNEMVCVALMLANWPISRLSV